MAEPFSIATAVLGLIGGAFGASEKAFSLFQKIWPAQKIVEQRILVELAKQLPDSERQSALKSMEGVYQTLSSANEHIERYRRDQLVRSVYKALFSTLAASGLGAGGQVWLNQKYPNGHFGQILCLIFCAGVSFISSRTLFNFYAPPTAQDDPKVKEGNIQIRDLALLSFQARHNNNLRTNGYGDLDPEDKDAVAALVINPFYTSYELLLARIQALEHDYLKVSFDQASDSLMRFFLMSFEEVVAEMITSLVDNGWLVKKPSTSNDDWLSHQREVIHTGLSAKGIEYMLEDQRYQAFWDDDLATIAMQENGKEELLRKLRKITEAPRFAVLD